MSYRTPVAEIVAMHKEYAVLPDIVVAANRLCNRTERAMKREWWKGIVWALSAVLTAVAVNWCMLR